MKNICTRYNKLYSLKCCCLNHKNGNSIIGFVSIHPAKEHNIPEPLAFKIRSNPARFFILIGGAEYITDKKIHMVIKIMNNIDTVKANMIARAINPMDTLRTVVREIKPLGKG